MRLNRIEIENFKGIGERQAIEMKPITLLFGPNSAGKSTILQVLHYIREILERGNTDPDVTIAGGLIDLGGFAALVHNHELSRTVRLRLSLDLSDEQGAEGLPLNSGSSFGEPEFSELPIRYLVGESDEYKDYAIAQQVGLAIEVSWSELERAPYVSRFSVELDNAPVATIVSPPQSGRAQLTEFNFSHPLLQRALLPDEGTDRQAEPTSLSSLLEEALWPPVTKLSFSVNTKWTKTHALIVTFDVDDRQVVGIQPVHAGRQLIRCPLPDPAQQPQDDVLAVRFDQ